MNEKNIESILVEHRSFPPDESFVAKARVQPADAEALYAEAEQDYLGFWANRAREELTWDQPFTNTLDESNAPNYEWFADGTLNVSKNCLDVNVAAHGDKAAIIFEGEQGDRRVISYAELLNQVCLFANALKAQGVQSGDRVIIYMPMTPEAVIAMQACARIGAVHSVVFGGFSANALRDRIIDAGATVAELFGTA